MTIVCALLLATCAVQDGVSQEEFDKMKKELEELKKKVEGGQDQPDLKTPEGQERSSLYSRLGSFTDRVHLGGYLDLEYINKESSASDTFDAHRFVPFIYADVTDHIKIAVELEIEHGNEVGIEFATLDLWFEDEINVRAGIILLPLGQFNLVHDAPFQDLTIRPMVDLFVIPAVLRDPGVSLFGRFDFEPWIVDYEIAITNGFKGLDKAGADAEIDTTVGLRDARPHNDKVAGTKKYRDFNDNKAVTARLAVSPFLGLQVGVSGHVGKYDQRGDGDLTIWAADLTLRGGGIWNQWIGDGAEWLEEIFFSTEIVAEYANADIEETPVSPAAQPDFLEGFYVEYRYHFFFDALRELDFFGDESTFTFVYRYGKVNLDGFKTKRHTFGLNLRPLEAAVIKFEWQVNRESGDKLDVDDDAFIASLSTYF